MEKKRMKVHGKEEVAVEEESARFFRNSSCEFFPCHKGLDETAFNCLFCYCPLYYAECLGECKYRTVGGFVVKDCSGCDYPHRVENYASIVEYLRLMLMGEVA